MNPSLEVLTRRWEQHALGALKEFVAMPALSPGFDANWDAHGELERAVRHGERFCREHLPGAHVEVIRLPGRTPVLLVDDPGPEGRSDGGVLFYGHLDKQPENTGWSEGLGPWEPVVRDGRLYGRGAVDDGYALYSAVTAVASLDTESIPRPRTVFLIETCEESGSYDLPAYLDELAERIGRPDLVVVPDAGCGSYDRLWSTTSLRGMVTGTLRVDVLREGVHSGDAGGVVPSSFRILRSLLNRLEDAGSGRIRVPECQVPIPDLRRRQAEHAGAILGEVTRTRYPFLPAVEAQSAAAGERILDRSWRACVEVTGAEGLPALEDAGNVLRPWTAVRLALRLPPTADAAAAADAVTETLESDPPHGARVRFETDSVADGWAQPDPSPWLDEALESASADYFGHAPVHMGEGGTIPLLAWLQARFPDAQYLVTGVAGPGSNSHGPDEFLHLDAAQRLTACLARVVAATPR